MGSMEEKYQKIADRYFQASKSRKEFEEQIIQLQTKQERNTKLVAEIRKELLESVGNHIQVRIFDVGVYFLMVQHPETVGLVPKDR